MKYNILYWILTDGSVPPSDPFYKRSCPVTLSDAAEDLRKLLVPAAVKNDGRLGLYASALCAFSADTVFGDDIRKLDPYNTYLYPERTPGSAAGEMTLSGVTVGADLPGIIGKLDRCIADQLVAPQWVEVMSAGCLQALRGMV